MNEDTIRQEVLDALAAIAPGSELGDLDPAAPLQDELDLDSMDMLNLITRLSERLRVAIPERDYGQLSTLDGCVAYLGEATAAAT